MWLINLPFAMASATGAADLDELIYHMNVAYFGKLCQKELAVLVWC
jgi:hypothetical protein